LKLFDIEYKFNDKILKNSISEVVFFEFKENLLNKGGEIISATERPLPKRKKKISDRNSIEKSKYYYSKYGKEKRRLNNNIITKREYKKRIDLLKTLREECKTKTEFKKKYEKKYK